MSRPSGRPGSAPSVPESAQGSSGLIGRAGRHPGVVHCEATPVTGPAATTGTSPTRTAPPAHEAVSRKISVPSTVASSPSASTCTSVRPRPVVTALSHPIGDQSYVVVPASELVDVRRPRAS